METRPVPTPAVLAATHPRRPAPGRPADAPSYDRQVWETAIEASDLFYAPRLVGYVLAHHAGADGYLRAGGIQNLTSLADRTGLTPRTVKLCLRDLGRAGLLRRPASAPGEQTHIARPITLTVPETAERVPPSTGEPR
jgi:hypothetical protein